MQREAQKKKIMLFIVLFVVLVLAGSFVIAALRSSKVEAGGREGYIEVLAVPGVRFEVNKELSDYATAVMEVSKDVEFDKTSSYSYKNGKDTYMLFNMSQYIIVAKKGTGFGFDTQSVEESLAKNTLNGIWISNPTGKTVTGDKCTVNVDAQVVITNTVYNDFQGKLSTINVDGTEWALFVGTVKDLTSDMVAYTSQTFQADPGNTGENLEVYEMEVEAKPQLVKVEEEETATVAEPSAEIVSLDEPEETEAAMDGETEVEIEPVEEPEVIEEPEEEPIVEEPEVEPEPVVDESQAEEETIAEPEVIEESKEEHKPETATLLVSANNQSKAQRSDTKAYTSTIYSMLRAGKIGYMTATNQKTGLYDEIFVRISSFNDEQTTNSLIEEYIKSGNSYLKDTNAPLGTHWESVTYGIKYDSENSYYVNVQLVGLDGEKLKHRGVSYSKKCYDIDNKTYAGEDGWIEGYVAFYAVPNGCTEYAVACGDSVETLGYKAYYRK